MTFRVAHLKQRVHLHLVLGCCQPLSHCRHLSSLHPAQQTVLHSRCQQRQGCCQEPQQDPMHCLLLLLMLLLLLLWRLLLQGAARPLALLLLVRVRHLGQAQGMESGASSCVAAERETVIHPLLLLLLLGQLGVLPEVLLLVQ
jgi:hypothetical protein